LDPPDDPIQREDTPPQPAWDQSVRKAGDRKFVVVDIVAFDEKVRQGQTLSLLRWIGQHQTAAVLQQRFFGVSPKHELPNAELRTIRRDGEEYVAVGEPLAPELGLTSIRLLRALRPDLRNKLEEGELPDGPSVPTASAKSRLVSEGALGTAFIVEGLEI
jgi:hypothetical protein